MTTQPETLTSWSWLRGVSRELFELDQKPLFGFPPPFPWEKLAQELSKNLSLKNAKFEYQEFIWREASDLFKEFQAPNLLSAFACTGVDGEVVIAFQERDILFLMKDMLQIEESHLQNIAPDLFQSFFQFIQLETLYFINELAFDKKLPFKLLKEPKELSQPCLTQDIAFTYEGAKVQMRLFISPGFQKSLTQSNYKTFGTTALPEQLKELDLTLHVEAARVQLNLEELKEIKPGDFILFDRIFYDPTLEKSSCVITLNNQALMQAEYKDGSLKITEIASTHEVL